MKKERNVTVNFIDNSGQVLGSASSKKNLLDGIYKAAKIAKLNTAKRQDAIKSLGVNIIVNR